MELTLDCKARPDGSKANQLRQSGQIPAVLYGHDGAKSVSLTVDAKDADILLRKASLNNTLVQLNIPDLSWNGKALIREIHTHPWKGSLYHLSFFSVAAQEFLEVDVPLHLVGEAPGVKVDGGSLDQELSELRVRCAPDAIPEVIEINVSQLNLGGALHVHELVLPAGVTAMGEPDRVVVQVLGVGSTVNDEAETAAETA